MKKLNYKTKIATALSVLVILGVAFYTAALVRADTLPTIGTAIQNSSDVNITSAPIGLVVHDSVTVSSTTGTSTPTGTVDFQRFPNTTCSGTGVVQAGVPLVNGIALSATTTVPSTGLSYKVHYNGQTDVYAPVTSTCVSVIATSATTTITTDLSASTAVASSTVYDTAVLHNATANATGTVAYTVFTNNACSANPMSAGVVSVTNASVPNSASLFFSTPGTYYWQAVYSGDANNSAATSSCVSEILTITAATTTPTTTPAHGSISGTVYQDLNRSKVRDAGEPVLAGWTINLYRGSDFDHKNPIMTKVSNANGFYTFGNLPDGTYSVEEINKVGNLRQFTPDYKALVIVNGADLTGKDFGNVVGDPSDHGDKDNKDNKDKKDKKDKKDNPGKHWGWFIGVGNPHRDR